MNYGNWKPYVSVSQRREKAGKLIAKAKKTGKEMHPVVVQGRTIAQSFWGKAWCNNLENYSDFANRLPRGRTYVRNGSVIDLRIEPGKIRAQVMGSSLYQIDISINAISATQWSQLQDKCTGTIASLVELLQGKLSKAVMEHICTPHTGLFPTPNDIKFTCSCPDWATMCKHVAAVLYGVGSCLDQQPQLLFTLRQVNADDLVGHAETLSVHKVTPSNTKVLDDTALDELFDIEMEMPAILTASDQTLATSANPLPATDTPKKTRTRIKNTVKKDDAPAAVNNKQEEVSPESNTSVVDTGIKRRTVAKTQTTRQRKASEPQRKTSRPD